jgi:hypothetical protein
MGLAMYEIIGSGSEWFVRHDGKDENVYDTKVSAFEHAVNAASIALRLGHGVRISAPAMEPGSGAVSSSRNA